MAEPAPLWAREKIEYLEGKCDARAELVSVRADLIAATAERNAARSDLASITTDRNALRHQADRLRQLAATRRAELEQVKARAGWSGVLAAHLRFVCQAIEQAEAANRRGDEPGWQAAWRAVRSAAEQAAACLDAPVRYLEPRTGGIVRPRTLAEIRGEPSEVGDLVQAQTLYAGLPNLPVEPVVADDEQFTKERPAVANVGPYEVVVVDDEQVWHWNEHNDHTDHTEAAQ